MSPAESAEDAERGENYARDARKKKLVACNPKCPQGRGISDCKQHSEEYSSFMSMATDLLFSLHPDIAGGVRGLEAGARDRLFDDAGTLTTDKSREIQQQRRDGLDLAQAQTLALGAKHWSSANACLLQLQQDLQA